MSTIVPNSDTEFKTYFLYANRRDALAVILRKSSWWIYDFLASGLKRHAY